MSQSNILLKDSAVEFLTDLRSMLKETDRFDLSSPQAAGTRKVLGSTKRSIEKLIRELRCHERGREAIEPRLRATIEAQLLVCSFILGEIRRAEDRMTGL